MEMKWNPKILKKAQYEAERKGVHWDYWECSYQHHFSNDANVSMETQVVDGKSFCQ